MAELFCNRRITAITWGFAMCTKYSTKFVLFRFFFYKLCFLLFKYSCLHFPHHHSCLIPHPHLPPTILPPPFGFVHGSFIHVPWWPLLFFFPLSLPPFSVKWASVAPFSERKMEPEMPKVAQHSLQLITKVHVLHLLRLHLQGHPYIPALWLLPHHGPGW